MQERPITRRHLASTIDDGQIKEENEDKFDEGTLDPQYNQKYYTHTKSGRATWTDPKGTSRLKSKNENQQKHGE